jgi:hypothetical protein
MSNQKTSQLANVLNVKTSDNIEARRSDHSIPYMTAMSAVHVDDIYSPFPADVHHEGWKLAAAVGNDVQRYQPNYLNTARTSL